MTELDPEDIAALTIEVRRLRAEVRSTRRSWRGTLAVLIVAILLGTAGLVALKGQADSNQEQTTEIQSSRAEARRAVCTADNIRITQHNDLAEAVRAVVALAAPPNVSRTQAQQAQVDAFLAKTNTLLDSTIVPERDCSPAGIERYYSTGK